MDCKSIDDLLVDYLYEEIDAAQAEAFEAHLEACERCAAEVASFKQTRLAVGELEELEPPPEVGRLLLAEAARAAPSQRTFGERLRALMRVFVMHPALAAAATLVVVLGISFYTYRQGLPPARHERRSDLPLGFDNQGAIHPASGTRAAPAPATEARPELARQQADPSTAPPVHRFGEGAGKGGGGLKDAPGDKNAGALAGKLGSRGADADDESGLRVSGPVTRGYKRDTASEREQQQRKVATTAVPPVQAAAPAGANVDDLKREDARDRRAAGRTVDYAPKKRIKRPARASTPSARPTPKPSARRARTRRLANTADVGGGSAGIWSNKGQGRGYVANAPAKQQAVKQGAVKQEAKEADGFKAVAKSKKTASKASRLLAAGDAAVRQGRCRDALDAYLKLLGGRPDLVETVAARLTPCQGKLGKGYQVVARRAAARKAKRRARKAKRARPANQKKRAAPAADAYAK